MRRKSAYWIQHTSVFYGDEYECSVCGYISDEPYTPCPNCGRPMKGSKYDPSWVDEMATMDAFFDD
jgi:rubrerythrin